MDNEKKQVTYNSIIGRLYVFSNLFLSLWPFLCLRRVFFI